MTDAPNVQLIPGPRGWSAAALDTEGQAFTKTPTTHGTRSEAIRYLKQAVLDMAFNAFNATAPLGTKSQEWVRQVVLNGIVIQQEKK